MIDRSQKVSLGEKIGYSLGDGSANLCVSDNDYVPTRVL